MSYTNYKKIVHLDYEVKEFTNTTVKTILIHDNPF